MKNIKSYLVAVAILLIVNTNGLGWPTPPTPTPKPGGSVTPTPTPTPKPSVNFAPIEQSTIDGANAVTNSIEQRAAEVREMADDKSQLPSQAGPT